MGGLKDRTSFTGGERSAGAYLEPGEGRGKSSDLEPAVNPLEAIKREGPSGSNSQRPLPKRQHT